MKTGEVGQLPCSEGRMSRMVSQLGSKPAFGSGDEKPKELNKLWWFVFEMRVHTLQVCTIRRYWVGAPTFPYRALTRKEGWCSCVKWRCCVQNPLMTIKSSSRQKINPAKINFNHLMWACQMIISTAVKVVSLQPIWWKDVVFDLFVLCRSAPTSWTSRGWWSSPTWRAQAPTTSPSSTSPSWRSW